MAKAFTFAGATTESSPYIPWVAFKKLDVGTIVNGVVESVSSYQGRVKIQMLVNDHITNVPLFDTTLTEAKELIGKPIKARLVGFNEKDGTEYPKLSIVW